MNMFLSCGSCKHMACKRYKDIFFSNICTGYCTKFGEIVNSWEYCQYFEFEEWECTVASSSTLEDKVDT